MTLDDPLLRARVSVPDHVVLRRFADDSVALNLSTGSYHGLNETAAVMVEALTAGATPAEVARSVAERAGVAEEQVATDLLELLHDLSERGLVEIHEPA